MSDPRIVLTAAELAALQNGEASASGLVGTMIQLGMIPALTKDAADLSDPNPVDPTHVIALMEKQFPLKALSWVKQGAWHGPVHVPLDRIDFRNEESWAAHHQPEAVSRFARQMKAGTGHTHPVILVQSPDQPKAIVIDGHHRVLACRKLGWPAKAYLGTFKTIPEAALETHAYQAHQGEDPANKEAKLPKASVDYRPATGHQRCGNCVMIRPDADGGWNCTLVKGVIDPDATCDRWYGKTEKAAKGEPPVAAGLAVRAADTGRVLMLQRAFDEDDPAGGYWECPGGCLDDGEDALDAARREFAEETGRPVPEGDLTGLWNSSNGRYRGFVITVPSEDAVGIFGDRDEVPNPDDPDRDAIEALAWFDPAQLKDSSVIRPELAEDQKRVRRALKSVAPAVAKDGRSSAEVLREYWTHEGHPGPTQWALEEKIGWGREGDWARCCEALTPYIGADGAKGYCLIGSSRILPARVRVPVDEPIGDAVASDAGRLAASAMAGSLGNFAWPELSNAYERYYVGDVIVIHLASGHELTITPNHPVATPGGWVPAAELHAGSDVLCSTGADWGTTATSNDEDRVIPSIEQVAKSMPLAFTAVASAVDFHGDGAGSEVYAVRADRLLVNNRDLGVSEHVGHGLLVGVDDRPCFAGAGSLEVSAADGRGSVDLSGCRVHGIADGSAEFDAVTGQQAVDPFHVDPVIPRDGDNRIPRLIAADDDRPGPCEPGKCAPVVAHDGDAFAAEQVRYGSIGASHALRYDRGGFPSEIAGDHGCCVKRQRLAVLRMPDGDAVLPEYFGDEIARDAQVGGNDLDLDAFGIPREDGCGIESRFGSDEAARLPWTTRDIDIVVAEQRSDATHPDVQVGGYLGDGLTAPVTTQNVLSIERAPFSGHVYNLSTASGWYVAESIIVANCNLRHHEVLGYWPAQHAEMEREGKA